MERSSDTLIAIEIIIGLLSLSEIARTVSNLTLDHERALEQNFADRLGELSLLIDQLRMQERASLLMDHANERALSRWIPERVVQWVIELGPLEKKRALKNTGLVAVLNEHIHDFDLMRWETQ